MPKQQAELHLLPISQIDDHPDNPRLVFRDDVIDAIAANLNGEFPQKHACHVRPIGERFQLTAGHHRKRAAEKAGLAKVWCWVETQDDETAFMELVTANNQGELSPLEIGIHALKAVPKGEKGRGKKGGLSEYARRIGKTNQYVGQLVDAAEVLENSNLSLDFSALLDKAKHLCAVRKLPLSCWPAAVEHVVAKSLSVDAVEQAVAKTKQFLESPGIEKRWVKVYLPPEQCAAAVFCGESPTNFGHLSITAEKVYLDLDQDLKELAAEWKEWLESNAGGDSWQMRKIQDKRIEFEHRAYELRNQPEVKETVSVLLADPPWQYDFAETDSRQIENQYPTATVDQICNDLQSPLAFAHELADDCVLYLWATAPKLQEALQVMKAWGFTYKTGAVWDKEKIGMGYWFRGQHELLLVGTRGKASPPEASNRVASVFRETRTGHSVKPECVYAAVEAMFPNAVKCEMYQRRKRQGWLSGGNESG